MMKKDQNNPNPAETDKSADVVDAAVCGSWGGVIYDESACKEIAGRLDAMIIKRLAIYRICWPLSFLTSAVLLALANIISMAGIPGVEIISVCFIICANVTLSCSRISNRLSDYRVRLLLAPENVIRELIDDDQSPDQGLKKFMRQLQLSEALLPMALSLSIYLLLYSIL